MLSLCHVFQTFAEGADDPVVVIDRHAGHAAQNGRQQQRHQIGDGHIQQGLKKAARLPPVVLPDVGGNFLALHNARVQPRVAVIPQGKKRAHGDRAEGSGVVRAEHRRFAVKGLLPDGFHIRQGKTHQPDQCVVEFAHAFLPTPETSARPWPSSPTSGQAAGSSTVSPAEN